MGEKKRSEELGTEDISSLLIKQSVPASIGILILSLYMIVDTIFVGQWVGSLAIAAITVVMPIMYLISSIGMAIGIGGSSIISRALGAGDKDLANKTFSNQVILTAISVLLILVPGILFEDEILMAFGGQGEILPYAKEYYRVVMLGIPFLAFAMMANSVVRSIGRPKVSMRVMITPAVVNIILDPILIKYFDMGLGGAAWATTISYLLCALYVLYFFLKGQKEISITKEGLRPDKEIIKEISSLGSVTLARQASIAVLSSVVNNSLIAFGGEIYVAVYGIIGRVMMLAFFPAIGLTQGVLPIVGYNYGANQFKRVKKTMSKSILYSIGVSLVLYVVLLVFKVEIVSIFTDEVQPRELTPPALLIVMLMMPLVGVQMIGSAYFQAIGKAIPALLLTLTRQFFFLLPMLFILPQFFGLNGIWYSFPIADVLATIVTFVWMKVALNKLGK